MDGTFKTTSLKLWLCITNTRRVVQCRRKCKIQKVRIFVSSSKPNKYLKQSKYQKKRMVSGHLNSLGDVHRYLVCTLYIVYMSVYCIFYIFVNLLSACNSWCEYIFGHLFDIVIGRRNWSPTRSSVVSDVI